MQVNDYVIYGNAGICKVSDMIHPDFVEDKTKMYYVLISENMENSVFYVPVEIAESKCRKIISKQDAETLIENAGQIGMEIAVKDNYREQLYKEALREGNLERIIGILKNISMRKEKRKAAGKKITAIDDKYFRIADKTVCRELGFALNLTDDEVRERLISSENK